MGRARVVGISVAVALAISLVASAAASAGAPEFGRCLKQPTKALSNFDSARCVKLASEDAGSEAEQLKKGNYQWFSGVVSNHFTSKLEAGNFVVLESVIGDKVTCAGETTTGEYASSTEVRNVVMTFSFCERKVMCESPKAGDGRVITAPLAGSLGFEKIDEGAPDKSHLALELHAEGGGNVVAFECGGLKIVVEGTVLHKITANAMRLTAPERFAQARGKQKPDHFAGGVPGEHVLELSTNLGPFEQAGLSFKATVTNEEAVEASTVN